MRGELGRDCFAEGRSAGKEKPWKKPEGKKEKCPSFLQPPQSPLWDAAPPWVWLEPALPLWELRFWMDFTSQVFILQCQGNFYTLEWFFGPSSAGSHGSATTRSWDGLSPPSPPDTSSQAVNSTGNNFFTFPSLFFQGKSCFFQAVMQ